MTPRRRASVRIAVWVASLGMLAVALPGQAQMNGNERAFPQSKAAIEKALTAMQASMAGHLPVLDGFAKAEHPLDRYQRGYYQATVQVSSVSSGGSVVRVSTKVTAWYSDPVASRSAYQLLGSNGRIEADLLDQLAEQLAKGPTQTGTRAASSIPPKPPSNPAAAEEPAISAPSPKFPTSDQTFSSSLSQGLAAHELTNGRTPDAANADKTDSTLQAEANSLEEVLKNTAHPKNLVAVKKSGTPVVATPSLTAKPQFLASMHDEFEMLDFNADWVHVRISGLSRGWIWRNSLEMPEGIPNTETHAGPGPVPPAAELFHATREQTAPFPGDWEPLRGKSVMIISVEKRDENAGGSRQEKLEFAQYLLEKTFSELAQKPQGMAGVVLIFDSADGGMIATTLTTLQQWKAGKLSDAALWHQSFFDPPEVFTAPSSSATR